MNSQAKKPLICRHIKTSGHRCQSIAIGSSAYCYYHRTMHQSHRSVVASQSACLRPETVQYLLQNGQSLPQPDPPAIPFPPLEDADSVQLAISMLFTALAAGHVDPVQARTLLYALQIASYNVHSTTSASSSEQDSDTVVRRIVHTRHGQVLAAPGDDNGVPSQSERPKTLLQQFLADNHYCVDDDPDEVTPDEVTHLESNS